MEARTAVASATAGAYDNNPACFEAVVAGRKP
jgi:hypothetical protein